MSNLLKGNYELPKGSTKDGLNKSQPTSETADQEFERRALEKLGGSIAFVLKKNTFVWDGDETQAKKEDS
jgi:hypothetical protein